jgi:hypothetical protein
VEERNGMDLSVRFAIRALPDNWIDNILSGARARGVTLNDVFMAGLAQVCDRYVPLKHRPRRHSVALGSIVDLRPYSGQEIAEAFGLFLGFTNVVCRPADLRPEPRKTRRPPNAGKNASASPGRAPACSPASPPENSWQRPCSASIKNTHPSPHLQCEHEPLLGHRLSPRPLLDYIRVSPTGPMMPLVFATTTPTATTSTSPTPTALDRRHR